MKERINYSHKKLDKFDQVIKNSEKTTNGIGNKSILSDHNESDSSKNNSLNNTTRSVNTSQCSPEIDFSIESDDSILSY